MASKVSGEPASRVFEFMPVKLVFAYEHVYFLQQGFKVKGYSADESLEDLITTV